MDWRTKIGIAIVPIVFLALWFLLTQMQYFKPVAEEPFVNDGILLKDNPGFEPGVWYLSYEEPGAPGLSVPLVFDHDSRCGSEGMLTICDISFDQGQRVHVEGARVGEAVQVVKLEYQRSPL